MSAGTLTRPNRNPVLNVMRDSFDGGDPWGSAIMWAFAVAEVLDAACEDVPDEMGFQPSPYVHIDPETVPEEYPDCEVWHLLHRTPGHWVDPEFGATVDELKFAGRCLARYLDWCKSAGLDY